MNKVIPYAVIIALFAGLINFNIDKIKVNGVSMEPLIKEGQILWGVKTDIFSLGDIVVVETLKDEKVVSMVKRIYGVEGDTICIKGKEIYRNDELIKILTYELNEDVELKLNKDEFFIMGDNPSTIWMKINRSNIKSRIEKGVE